LKTVIQLLSSPRTFTDWRIIGENGSAVLGVGSRRNSSPVGNVVAMVVKESR